MKKVGIGYSFSKEKEIEELKAKIKKLESGEKADKKAENKNVKQEKADKKAE